MKHTARLLSLAALLASYSSAHASYKVYSPYVTKGDIEVEGRGSYVFDDSDSKDGKQKDKWAVGYGVTDWWSTEVYAITGRANNDSDYEYQFSEWSNKFALFPKGTYWADFGAYIAYEHSHNSGVASEIEAKFIARKNIEKWSHTLNLNFGKEVGEHAEGTVGAGLSWQTVYKHSKPFGIGLELYSSFGEVNDFGGYDEQSHLLGPVITGKLGEVKYELGYLFGISKGAPDGALKWLLEVEF